MEGNFLLDLFETLRHERKIKTQKDFGKKLGYGPSFTSRLLNGSEKWPSDLRQKLYETFEVEVPDLVYEIEMQRRKDTIPSDTLSLGEPGETFITKGGNEFIELEGGGYLMMTELVQEKSAAGYITGWGDPEYIKELPKHALVVEVPHKGYYRTFVIADNNDSMNDGTSQSIEPKDRVSGRLVNRSLWEKSKLHLGQWPDYVIVHRDGITTKRIIEHNIEKGYICCHSLNPDKAMYPDFKLELKDIIQIWNVVQVTKERIK